MILEVLNCGRDDLHDFAEYFLNTLTFASMNSLCKKVVDCGPVQGAVLHQKGSYQVELITFAPGLVIPSHSHPGTDSIEYLVAGMAKLRIGDFDPFNGLTELASMRLAKCKGLRIPENEKHSGEVSATGAMILSFQRWKIPLTHIGLNWEGDYAGTLHESACGVRHAH